MATASRPILTGKSRLGAEWRQYEAIFPALATSRIDQVSVECVGAKVPLDLLGLLNDKEVLLMRSEVGLASVRSSLGEQPPLRREGISGSHKTPRWREMDSNCWYRGAEWWISATPHDSGVRSTLRWRKKDSNLRSPKRRVLRARDALRSCQGCGTREDPWNGQPLAFLAALRIRSSAFIDTHLSRRRSRAFRPKAPFHAGRRRCRHSTTSVEAELWITDQYFGAAKKRDSAIDARG